MWSLGTAAPAEEDPTYSARISKVGKAKWSNNAEKGEEIGDRNIGEVCNQPS